MGDEAGSPDCTSKCKQHANVYVVNTVLTYVMCSMSRANGDSVILVMNSTFTGDEMVNARKALWHVSGETAWQELQANQFGESYQAVCSVYRYCRGHAEIVPMWQTNAQLCD